MARRSRTEINRAALNEVVGGLADGVFDLARAVAVVAANDAPDSPYEPYPTGKGLPEQGGVLVYWNGKRTHEYSTGHPGTPNLPRGIGVRKRIGYVLGIVGFGFPCMFNELGTVKMHAQPFLTPAASDVIGSEAPIVLSAAMERRLRGQRSPNTAKIKARIAASRAAKSGGTG